MDTEGVRESLVEFRHLWSEYPRERVVRILIVRSSSGARISSLDEFMHFRRVKLPIDDDPQPPSGNEWNDFDVNLLYDFDFVAVNRFINVSRRAGARLPAEIRSRIHFATDPGAIWFVTLWWLMRHEYSRPCAFSNPDWLFSNVIPTSIKACEMIVANPEKCAATILWPFPDAPEARQYMNDGKSNGKKSDGPTVNDRMKQLASEDPAALGWSARKWASAIGCSTSTIGTTEFWGYLKVLKAEEATKRRSRQR